MAKIVVSLHDGDLIYRETITFTEPGHGPEKKLQEVAEADWAAGVNLVKELLRDGRLKLLPTKKEE